MLQKGDRILTYGAIIRRVDIKGVNACKPVILCDDWDKADLRWEDPAFGFSRGIACNVVVTGNTVFSFNGAQWMRGKLTWIHDDEEPNTSEPVLIRVDWNRELVLTNSWAGMDGRRIGERKA